MKLKDWSNWRVSCSGISEIMSRPKVPSVTARERQRLDKINAKEDVTVDDEAFVDYIRAKQARFDDPELSVTATKHLIRKYSWEKYNRRVASIDFARSATRKGTILEEEAIEIVSTLDNQQYKKEQGIVGNEYIYGVCDVFHSTKRKIVDVKASWNIYSFMPNYISPVSVSYWYQMQGYMELYNADIAEVCYVLVNTPSHLITLERGKLADKYLTGEITKDKYDEGMEGLEHAFDYDKIPIKRRVIRQVIKRHSPTLPLIYSKVIKCRAWLSDFEKIHMNNHPIIISPDRYAKQGEEDNIELDT
jgi:hypothetical protein